MKIDIWHKDEKFNIKDITRVDCFFSDLDCEYRGNLYIGDKIVGDYSTSDSTEIEKKFSHLKPLFN